MTAKKKVNTGPIPGPTVVPPSPTLNDFDSKCKDLVDKNKMLKALDREVKDLKKDVLTTLLTRDEDDQKYHAAGATISVRHMAIITVPKDANLKFKMFSYIKDKAPEWYSQNLTFNHRSLTSYYNEEERVANEAGNEYGGIPGAICDMKETLSIRGG